MFFKPSRHARQASAGRAGPNGILPGSTAMTDLHVLMVVQKGDHSLGFYDMERGDELERIPLDPFPHEFVLGGDGRHAFICHFGVALAEDPGPGGNTVSIVDIHARGQVGTVDCGENRRPHGIDFDEAGRLFVLSEGSSNLLVIGDPFSGAVDRFQPTGGKGSHILSVTPDGAVAFSVAAETGLEIMSASAECAGCQLFTEHVGASELRGVIVGEHEQDVRAFSRVL
ncbi:MAG: YncE family protein, partial [Nitrospinaceae bacterium]